MTYVNAKISRRSFAAGTGALFATIGLVRTPARAETTTFKVSYPVPATHPQHLRMIDAASAACCVWNAKPTSSIAASGTTVDITPELPMYI